MKRLPLKIFFCYAHEDRDLRNRMHEHLELLEREGLITPWYDGRIAPGSEWSEVIQENLRSADLVVFLISKAFLESKYIAEVEMRLALELHERRSARLVPVLTEAIEGFDKLPLAKLEALPSKAQPLASWEDPVRALDDVVAGIRRAAISLIIESGGPFEFGAHQFTEAELSELDAGVRARAMDGLKRLRTQLVSCVPRRRVEENLLIATWSLNRFGGVPQLPESLYYMAEVISAFDVVALQEIDRRLDALRKLTAILGPEWGYFISDITEGSLGSNERFAILYYEPRVAFEHITGEVVLPETGPVAVRQFARKPLLASFRSGDFRFRVCTAHITFGGGGPEGERRSAEERKALARFLSRVAERDQENIVVAGNFNLRRKDSDAIRTFRQAGFSIPQRIIHPSHMIPERYYSLLGLFLTDGATTARRRIRGSGVVNPFESVFRPEDEPLYSETIRAERAAARPEFSPRIEYDRMWRARQLSDHLPLWLELSTRPAKSQRRTTEGHRSDGQLGPNKEDD
jgi:endonuclease/exonuclease/phosphatase family metal-dependent hydrolase